MLDQTPDLMQSARDWLEEEKGKQDEIEKTKLEKKQQNMKKFEKAVAYARKLRKQVIIHKAAGYEWQTEKSKDFIAYEKRMMLIYC